MFCTSCGTHNADDAKFCKACGTPIINSFNPISTQEEPSNELYSGTASTEQVTEVYEQPVQNETKNEEEAKKEATLGDETVVFEAVPTPSAEASALQQSSVGGTTQTPFVAAQPAVAVAQQPVIKQPMGQPMVPPTMQQPVVYPAEQPIAPPAYMGVPAGVIFENAEPPKKKKTGLIIGISVACAVVFIAAAVISAFIFGFFGIGRGDPDDLYSAYLNMAEEGIVSYEVQINYSDYNTNYTKNGTSSVDFDAEIGFGEYETNTVDSKGYTKNDGSNVLKYTLVYDKSNHYEVGYDPNSGKIIGSNMTKYKDGYRPVVEFERLELFRELFDGGELDIDKLLEMQGYEDVKKDIEEGKYTKKQYKKAAEEFFKNLNNKEWMEQNLNFKCESSFTEQVYTISFNECDIEKVLLEAFKDLVDEDEYERRKNSLEKKKGRLDLETATYVFTVSFNKIKKAEVTMKKSTTQGDCENRWVVTFIDSKPIDLEKVKNTIDEYNEGHTDCRECNYYANNSNPDGSDKTEFSKNLYNGYCASCYKSKFCVGRCGKEPTIDGYCTDCFIQCSGCSEKYGAYKNKKNGKSYCPSCYMNDFCKCGNPRTKGDYCDDCYVECEECKKAYADYKNLRNGKRYCHECYGELFCDCGNEVYKDHYCKECYTPCIGCAQKAGKDYYDDYCYDCYYKKYCREYDCGKPIYKDGYCQEHFVPCVICGEQYGQEHYDGICVSCHSSYVQCSMCSKYATALYDGLCTDCYRNSEKCDKCKQYKFDVYDGLCGECHNVYKKCDCCTGYDRHLVDGLCSSCSYYYAKCHYCGQYVIKENIDDMNMCFDCYPIYYDWSCLLRVARIGL